MLPDTFKLLPHYCLPKHALTAFAGCLADVKIPFVKDYLIQDFIRRYKVNMQEALNPDPNSYASFNDFFIRHLNPSCRPIAKAGLISPVDGSLSALGAISTGTILQAKGRDYTVHDLLGGDSGLSSTFNEGHFITIYLSPKDYHRVHVPLDATVREMTYVPGRLFSVQPKTVRGIPNLFARNARLAVILDTALGPVAMVLVGATIVGRIGTSWHGDVQRYKEKTRFVYETPIHLKQASELGYFKLGSTVIMLFSDGAGISFRESLAALDGIRLGEALGTVRKLD